MSKRVENLREDVMWCAAQLQNHPEKFEKAMQDATTAKELRQLVGDLFSLCEVIVDDE